MLSKEDNERLTRVGPGTPMGELLRRYWMPVAALSEHGQVVPVILYQRTDFAASMIDGRTVTETAPTGRSAQEVAELWQYVYEQIGIRVAA